MVNPCSCLRFCFWRFVGSRSERVGYNSNALVNRVQFVVVLYRLVTLRCSLFPPEPLVMRVSQARYTVHTSSCFRVVYGLLSDLFPIFCLFVWDVSRGSTTGSNDDVQPRIVHSECGVMIEVTPFAPI